MASIVFVEKPAAEGLRLVNNLGADVAQGEFCVMAGKSLMAKEAVVSLAYGAFEDLLGAQIQAADYVSGEATFAAGELPVYWNVSQRKFSNTATSGNYLVGYTLAAKVGTIIKFIAIDPRLLIDDAATMSAAITVLDTKNTTRYGLGGNPFRKTVTITAAGAATPVHIVAAADVTGTDKVFVTNFLLKVNGATAWTDATGTIVTLQDTASSPVVGATFAKAGLTGQAVLGPLTANVTLAAPISTGVGFTAAKGLDIVADHSFAGSDIVITVVGFIAAA